MAGPDPRKLAAAARASAADAAQKSAAAQQLRAAARDLLGHVGGYQNLLQAACAADTPQTWRCPYGQSKTEQIAGWQQGLDRGAGVLLDRHAQWLRIADSLDAQAADLRGQAAQQQHQAQQVQQAQQKAAQRKAAQPTAGQPKAGAR